jgi:hypothetical protein
VIEQSGGLLEHPTRTFMDRDPLARLALLCVAAALTVRLLGNSMPVSPPEPHLRPSDTARANGAP